MKSILKNEKNKSDNNIILSIGMIIKNEENVLARCLDSLVPLMSKIPSELIIADTGSTDNSIEIARRYTDNVFSFKWIDDFAAARNSTLERAKGKWYLFIDADEYLDDDIDELVNFFSDPNVYLYCKTAQIHLRNHLNNKEKKFVDMYLPRFHRINLPDEKVEFIGKVHETINMRNPQARFSTILHHTGYFYENEESKKAKHDRNEKIMLELYKENPEDVRLLSLMFANEHRDEVAEKYINQALDIVRKNTLHYFYSTIYVQSIQHYIDLDKEKTIKICDEYEQMERNRENVAVLSVYTLKAIAYMRLEEYEKALDVYKKYFEKYEEYKNNKLDVSAMVLHVFPGTDENDYFNNVYNQLFGLYKLKKVDEFIKQLKTIDFHKVNVKVFKDIYNLFYVCMFENKKYDTLMDGLVSGIKYDSEKNNIIDTLIYTFYFDIKDEKLKQNILLKASMLENEYDFITLSKFLIEPYKMELNEKLKAYISEKRKGYEYAVYIAIKNSVDITDEIKKSDVSDYSNIFNTIMLNYHDFPSVIINYRIKESFFSDIKLFCWITRLYEIAALNASALPFEERKLIYGNFIAFLCDYVNNIYNPELLNDDDISVLPDIHIFGYYMYKANTELIAENRVGYVQYLKKALASYEPMKEIVEFYIEELKKNV